MPSNELLTEEAAEALDARGSECAQQLATRERLTASSSKGPSRAIVNLALDILLLVAFVALGASALVVRFVFPQATAAAGWSLWGWNLDQWIDGQVALIGILAMIVLLHVMLHWTWVCGVVSSRIARRWPGAARWDDGTRTLLGVGLLILLFAVVGLFLAAAAMGLQAPA